MTQLFAARVSAPVMAAPSYPMARPYRTDWQDGVLTGFEGKWPDLLCAVA